MRVRSLRTIDHSLEMAKSVRAQHNIIEHVRPTRACSFPAHWLAHRHAQGQTKGRREGCPPRARARPGTLTLRNIKRTGRRTNNVILFNLRFFLLFFDYTIFRISSIVILC